MPKFNIAAMAFGKYQDSVSSFFEDVSLVEFSCIYRMPGGDIVGDSALCCCVPVQCVTSIVQAQLFPTVC